MPRTVRTRFWIESALAALATGLFLLTLIWPEWIETLFSVDPDQGSGAVEWAAVASLIVASVAFSAMARVEWHRHPAIVSR